MSDLSNSLKADDFLNFTNKSLRELAASQSAKVILQELKIKQLQSELADLKAEYQLTKIHFEEFAEDTNEITKRLERLKVVNNDYSAELFEAHSYLDNKGIPRQDESGYEYCIFGRIYLLSEKINDTQTLPK